MSDAYHDADKRWCDKHERTYRNECPECSAPITKLKKRKRTGNLKLLHIASDHIDIMCQACCTAFDIRKMGAVIKCPNCGNSSTEEE